MTDKEIHKIAYEKARRMVKEAMTGDETYCFNQIKIVETSCALVLSNLLANKMYLDAVSFDEAFRPLFSRLESYAKAMVINIKDNNYEKLEPEKPQAQQELDLK